MANCKSIQPNITKICAADFNRKIKVQCSSIAPNNAPGGTAEAKFVDLFETWAMVKTSGGINPRDGVNINSNITVDFFIRYTSKIEVEQQVYVERSGKQFKIESIENIDKANQLIRLRAIQRGSVNINANLR